jgi:hypothetical protein
MYLLQVMFDDHFLPIGYFNSYEEANTIRDKAIESYGGRSSQQVRHWEKLDSVITCDGTLLQIVKIEYGVLLEFEYLK